MGVKSDKTFEEIVERLVAISRPQPLPEKSQAKKKSSPSGADTVQTTPSTPAPPAARDDQTP
jgi:hypothetical protein